MAFVAYKAWGLWEAKKAARYHQPPPVQAMQAPPVDSFARPVTARAPASAVPPTYAPAVAPQPVAPAEPARPRTGGTLYLCKDYSGGTFWASSHCSQYKALIDRMVSVPEGIPFEQQVQIAEQRRRILSEQAPEQVTVQAPPAQAVNNKPLCQSLDARVDSLDAMARQPQSGAMQDWIRSERQKTRDEQFRLHC